MCAFQLSLAEKLRMRYAQTPNELWLERNYDLCTVQGVLSIPASANLPKSPIADRMDVTSDLDYYLRIKAKRLEDDGEVGLAIACLQKSNEIRMITRRGHRKTDYYTLVRLLARHGYVDKAFAEKIRIDRFFGKYRNDCLINFEQQRVQNLLNDARYFGTDLVQMSAHENACPLCAPYQGRVYSLSGKSRKYPPIPQAFFTYGAIHEGCMHNFYIYTEGSNPMLDHTLSVHRIKKRRYRKNIVRFSNRPFIDDRPPEDIAAAIAHVNAMKEKEHKEDVALATCIEREFKRGLERRRYKWIQDNIPELCPKTFNSFQRMKSQCTRNYQKIRALAAEHNYDLDGDPFPELARKAAFAYNP